MFQIQKQILIVSFTSLIPTMIKSSGKNSVAIRRDNKDMKNNIELITKNIENIDERVTSVDERVNHMEDQLNEFMDLIKKKDEEILNLNLSLSELKEANAKKTEKVGLDDTQHYIKDTIRHHLLEERVNDFGRSLQEDRVSTEVKKKNECIKSLEEFIKELSKEDAYLREWKIIRTFVGHYAFESDSFGKAKTQYYVNKMEKILQDFTGRNSMFHCVSEAASGKFRNVIAPHFREKNIGIVAYSEEVRRRWGARWETETEQSILIKLPDITEKVLQKAT